MAHSLSIVIPAFNEEARLPSTLASLKKRSEESDFPWQLKQVLVVNDGSRDRTSEQVRSLAREWPILSEVKFRHNLGKGAAVYAGLRVLKKKGEQEFILVADADEATPWKELLGLAQVVESSAPAALYFASRRHPESRIVRRQIWWRESMGRGFNLLLRFLAGVSVKDTQCGFKLFRADETLNFILRDWSVCRFAWDAEVFLTCRRLALPIKEFAVEWRHVEASRVHPVRDSLQMAFEILRLRVKHSVVWLFSRRSDVNHFSSNAFASRIDEQMI